MVEGETVTRHSARWRIVTLSDGSEVFASPTAYERGYILSRASCGGKTLGYADRGTSGWTAFVADNSRIERGREIGRYRTLRESVEALVRVQETK